MQNFHKAATSGKDFSKYITKYLEHKKQKEDEKKGAENPPKKEEAPKVNIEKKEEKVKKPRPESPKDKKPIAQPKEEPKPEKPKPEERDTKEKKLEDENLGMDKGVKIKIGSKIGKFNELGNKEEKQTKTTINLKDLESIKSYIQEISKNSNPIGKIIDFLPEDIESMNKELSHWAAESNSYKEKIDEECKKSDEILLPLENEYLELEETIRDEAMRIRSIKSRILKNEQIIQNLINNVISYKHEYK